jgi:hypothetical protein
MTPIWTITPIATLSDDSRRDFPKWCFTQASEIWNPPLRRVCQVRAHSKPSSNNLKLDRHHVAILLSPSKSASGILYKYLSGDPPFWLVHTASRIEQPEVVRRHHHNSQRSKSRFEQQLMWRFRMGGLKLSLNRQLSSVWPSSFSQTVYLSILIIWHNLTTNSEWKLTPNCHWKPPRLSIILGTLPLRRTESVKESELTQALTLSRNWTGFVCLYSVIDLIFWIYYPSLIDIFPPFRLVYPASRIEQPEETVVQHHHNTKVDSNNNLCEDLEWRTQVIVELAVV